MSDTLLSTTFFIPQLRPGTVDRPRLGERLGASAHARLTLLSAPAGFGKTTALTAWLAQDRGRTAWLSLDGTGTDPGTFWTYVVTALQDHVPGLGALLPLLRAGQPVTLPVLTTLVNELVDAPEEVYLVLDDYHLVDGPDLAAGMAFVVDHLPPQVHVVISTRSDPDLPLGRLRARGELVEVRAADLRFTGAEAAGYLERAGLVLRPDDVAVLEERTEGWAAALQLAALSMRGRDDLPGFIAEFAGDDRYIVDYLVEEVLSRQPERIRDFLMRTSVLDRLTGPLCDALTGRDDGRATLEWLERANLFVVPLDAHRRWYRYHHLFGDVLRAHLLAEHSDALADLHLRASRWYEGDHRLTPAVRHALGSGDVDRAADLMEVAIPGLLRDRQEAVVRGWLDDLPVAVVRARPVLAMGFVGALMACNEFDAVPDRLADLERLIHGPGEGLVVLDRDELACLPGRAELYRTALALLAGDAAGVHRHAGRVQEIATADDHVVRAGAMALSGLAHWGAGEIDAAHRGYLEAIERMRAAGYVPDVLGCTIAVADLRLAQGRLREAQAAYEDGLRLAAGHPGEHRGTADMSTGLGQIALERNDLAGAAAHLARARELGERLGLPQNPYRWRVAMAQLRQAEGDTDAALALLEDAERVYVGDFSPNVRPIQAVAARMLVAAGQLDAAREWALEHDLAPDDELTYVHEYEHVTLARLLLARHRDGHAPGALRQAADLLRRLGEAAGHGGRTGTLLEILVLQALTQHAQGDVDAAMATLERALALAEPEGYERVITEHGAPMVSLLRRLPASRSGPFSRRLLLSCVSPATPLDDPLPAGRPVRRPDIVEPLSDRELEVLRLLAGDLDGPALARHLVVSLNTLRTHTRHIYAKLGVTSRRAAVRRGRELGLLG